MKQLSSVKVVQFFLFEKLDLRIGEICGVFGPNGSGKSSLLDAVQIAMFGANTRLSSFNAQADENMSNTRSIRSYCLGQYGDSEEDRVRDRATTYITLVWRDTETHEPLSMGVCIYAGIEGDGHEVLGRYLLRGVELSMGDHLELVNGRERPRDWAMFRHQLQERSKVSGEDPLFNDAERYVRAMLVALRGSGGVPQYDAFTRAFRFALRMRFDRPVDQIVRYQVLEARPTNIKKFKEVTESFKRLAAMVAEVEKKISEGELVEKDFARAEEESRRAATWKALGCSVAQEQATEDLDHADETLLKAEESLQQATEDLATAQARCQQAQDEASRYKNLREQHTAHAQSGELQNRIEEQRRIAESKRREFAAGVTLLRGSVRAASGSDFIINTRQALVDSVAGLDPLVAGTAGLTREDVGKSLKPALKAVSKALSELFETRRQIENDLERAQASLRSTEEDLARAKEGRAPLDPAVRRLLNELRDAGLSPTPVCDLVRVTDAEWQPVIEGYLGINTQALLVSETEESQAFAVYRGLSGGRAVIGAKIARESRNLGRRSPAAGSVAELIEGTHPAAVNYLRGKFGEARRASTDAEALASSHALTMDGMLVSGGEIDRKPRVGLHAFRLGGGSPQQLDGLNEAIVKVRKEVSGLMTRKTAAQQVWERLQPFAGESHVIEQVLAVFNAGTAAEQAVGSLAQRLSETADEEYVRLGEQERRWADQASTASATVTAGALAKGRAEEHLATCTGARSRAAGNAERAAAAANSAKADASYDKDFATRAWDGLLEQHASDYAAMALHCETQARACGRKAESAANAGSGKLGQFLAAHREHAAPDVLSDWRKSRHWMTELLQRLNETTLKDYRQRMDEAYLTSQATFRNDVALALNENIKWLKMTETRLNEVLRTCPLFSNRERYHFKRKVRPKYEDLLKFIENIADYGPADDLLGGPGPLPEQFRQLLDEKTAPGAGAAKTPLDDYREFFEFDIEIYREDPLTKKLKLAGHLSKRLGSGSGGEHRAPLYVIAGAALASAYRLEQAHTEGLRLILLDEAFNKMDMGNIIATMRYLEDLGLQVFMASPGENLGTLTAFLDRYFDILRDAERNVLRLQGHDVSAETRAMFRADLPEFNPELVDEEIRGMTPADISGAEVG